MTEEPSFEKQIVERVGRIEIDVQVMTERVTHLGDVALAFVESLKKEHDAEGLSIDERLGLTPKKPSIWMKLAEAAEYMSLSTSKLRRLHAERRTNRFPSVEREKLIRVKREDIDKWLMEGEERPYGRRRPKPQR